MQDVKDIKHGIPLFRIDATANNGLCDQLLDMYVILGEQYVMVNLGEKVCPCQFVEVDRVRFGFDTESRLVTIVIKNLTGYEYNELRESFNL